MLSGRVRHARLPVDRAILYLWPSLAREWAAQDKDPGSLPFTRDAVLSRYTKTMEEQMALRCVPKGHNPEKSRLFFENELKLFDANARISTTVPSKFKDLPPDRVFDYPADCADVVLDGPGVRLARDPESESGVAVVIPAADGDLPFETGMFGNNARLPKRSIEASDVVPGRYAWYRLGDFTLSSLAGTQVYLGTRAPVRFTPREIGTYEVWASIRFDGPMFAHGAADRKNEVSIDRVVLVKPRVEGDASISRKRTIFGPLDRADMLPREAMESIPREMVVRGTAVMAQVAEASSGSLDLAPMLGGTREGRAAYVFTTISVPRAGRVTFGFGADWWLQAWVDGELICDTTVMGNPGYPPAMTDNTATVALSKGPHVLAVRFISGQASSRLVMGAGAELRRE